MAPEVLRGELLLLHWLWVGGEGVTAGGDGDRAVLTLDEVAAIGGAGSRVEGTPKSTKSIKFPIL